MPALDGTSIVAMASFAALVLAWLAAPTSVALDAAPELSVAAA